MFPVQRYIQRKIISDLGRSLPNGNGFKGFIRGQSYVLEYDEEGENLFLGGVNEVDFVSALSHDYSRFALSGIESYERALSAVGESNTAWPAIQIYYSAYYFANSIMRACGVNVSRFKAEEVRALNELRLLFSLECDNIPSGDYRASWVPSASVGPKIKLEPISAGSGAHEKFWIVFSNFLQGLIEEIRQQGMPDALDAESSAGDLLRLLRARGEVARQIWAGSISGFSVCHRHDCRPQESHNDQTTPA